MSFSIKLDRLRICYTVFAICLPYACVNVIFVLRIFYSYIHTCRICGESASCCASQQKGGTSQHKFNCLQNYFPNFISVNHSRSGWNPISVYSHSIFLAHSTRAMYRKQYNLQITRLWWNSLLRENVNQNMRKMLFNIFVKYTRKNNGFYRFNKKTRM